MFSNRLFNHAITSEQERKQTIKKFINRTQRPVYFINKLPADIRFKDYWLYKKVVKSTGNGGNTFSLTPKFLNYFVSIARQQSITDPWTIGHRYILMARLVLPLYQYSEQINDEDERKKY